MRLSALGAALALVLGALSFPGALGQVPDHEPTLAITTYTFPGGARQDANVTLWYDTDYFNGEWTWSVPYGFTVTGVVDDFGPVAFTRDPDEPGRVSFETHYPFRSGYRSVSIFSHNVTAEPLAPGIYLARAWAGAANGEGSRARLVLEAPADGVILLPNGTQWSRWVDGGEEGIPQDYVFVHPEALDVYTLDQTEHYGLLAPASMDADAKRRLSEVVDAAEETLPDLERLFGTPPPSGGKYLVLVAPDTLFDWEAGWYRDGIIALRASAFVSPEKSWLLDQTRALVHETAHAFMDPVLEWAGPHGGWLNEGTARHAERLVERRLADRLVTCEPGFYCLNESSQLDHADLVAHYAGERPLDVSAWSPNDEQSEAARTFGYRFSAFLVGAYVQQHGGGAFRVALGRLAEREPGSVDLSCPACVSAAIEEDLLAASGTSDPAALYRPYFAEFQDDRGSFDRLVAPLVVAERSLLPPASSPLVPSGPTDGQASGAVVAPGTEDDPTVLFLAFAGAAVVPTFLYARAIRSHGRAPDASGLKRHRLRASAFAYGADGRLFEGARLAASDGPGKVLLSTRLRSGRAPLAFSFVLALLLVGVPLVLAVLLEPAGPLGGPLWLGLSLSWVLVVGYEAARHPRVLWVFDGFGATFRESGRFNRPKAAWHVAVADVEAVALRRAGPMKGAAGSHVLVLLTSHGERPVAALGDANDALALAALVAESCRCAVLRPESGSPSPSW